jgi:hypothetical protein
LASRTPRYSAIGECLQFGPAFVGERTQQINLLMTFDQLAEFEKRLVRAKKVSTIARTTASALSTTTRPDRMRIWRISAYTLTSAETLREPSSRERRQAADGGPGLAATAVT